MYDFSDIFANKPDDDNTREVMLRAVSQAKVCLVNPDFVEYKKQFESAKEKMVRSMISYTNTFMSQDSADMQFYGAKIARMITKLQDLQALLDAVESDVRKEKVIDA